VHLQQETVPVLITHSGGRFDDLMAELVERFAQVSFTLVQKTEREVAIYVHDTDFFFSPPFSAFLDELAGRLPPEQNMDLDFYPVEVSSLFKKGAETFYEIQGTAVPMHVVDPVQPKTAVGQGTVAPWDAPSVHTFSKAA
jgi:hypothetical protein